eukprot:CAMPEP_0176074466 /NCGR_PEP_ID=MMETSP0120_2-20121206/37214_1 /TAXON_ID=160619 /ORGANISM="Kryptoperidinium foliaceum, Strain CCMP 1326" /LENGTH=89 /DNA_ID=CAMNT_0017408161 /DNA_START=224 /DNA_END=493 /DNA_ORIENTATION=-
MEGGLAPPLPRRSDRPRLYLHEVARSVGTGAWASRRRGQVLRGGERMAARRLVHRGPGKLAPGDAEVELAHDEVVPDLTQPYQLDPGAA